MKFLSPCIKCAIESKEPNFNFNSIEMNDSGVYKVVCTKGHETNLFLQDEKFEILFDLGALALNDGYTRESVSSFAASLERFYEFFIQVLLYKKGINHETFVSTWKQVKNQSERQLGAFYFIYLNEFNLAPPIVGQKWVTFRNNVIHKGYIPSYNETFEYGKYLYTYIKQLLTILMEEFADYIWVNCIKRQIEVNEKQNLSSPLGVTGISQMIPMSTEISLFKQRNFESSLEELSKITGVYTK
jgi:hypothetical protein